MFFFFFFRKSGGNSSSLGDMVTGSWRTTPPSAGECKYHISACFTFTLYILWIRLWINVYVLFLQAKQKQKQVGLSKTVIGTFAWLLCRYIQLYYTTMQLLFAILIKLNVCPLTPALFVLLSFASLFWAGTCPSLRCGALHEASSSRGTIAEGLRGQPHPISPTDRANAFQCDLFSCPAATLGTFNLI